MFDIHESYVSFTKPDLERLDNYVNAPERWIAAVNIIRAMEATRLPIEERDGDVALEENLWSMWAQFGRLGIYAEPRSFYA